MGAGTLHADPVFARELLVLLFLWFAHVYGKCLPEAGQVQYGLYQIRLSTATTQVLDEGVVCLSEGGTYA